MAVITFGAVAGNANDDTKWVGGVAPGAADDVLLTSTSADCTITASVTWNSLNCTGYTAILTHNASVTLTLDGQDGLGNSLILVSGMTYTLGNALTSAITFTGAGTSKITTGTKTLGNVVFNNSGDTFQLQDNLTTSGNFTNTAGTFDPQTFSVIMTGATPTITPTAAISFYNLTRTGNAVKTDTLSLAGNITVTNTLNIDGNSSINRVLVTSNTLGTARTLTVTGATISGCSNVDFRDITFANGGSNVDLSAITGGSGDCGGNTISGGGVLSFTTADDKFWVGGTGSWSDDDNHWSLTDGGAAGDGNIPLPQDTCYFTNNSDSGNFTVTADMPRLGKTIDTSGYTDASTFTLTLGNAITIYGGLDLSGVTTLSGNFAWTFESVDRSGTFNLTSDGKSFTRNVSLMAIGETLVLTDNFSQSTVANNNLGIYNGTFDAATNNVGVTANTFVSNVTTARTINMGSGTWTATATGTEAIWNISNTTTTNLTLNEGTSTFVFGAGTGEQFFRGGGETYNNITINTTSGVATFTASNTFNTFTINAPKTVKFTAGTNTHVNSFVVVNDGVNVVNIDSTSAGTPYTLTDDNGGTNVNDYLSVTDCAGSPASTWYYGANGDADAYSLANGWAESPSGAATGFMTTMKGYW